MLNKGKYYCPIHTSRHRQVVSSDEEIVVTKISPYLRELKTFLFRVSNDFLQPFQCEHIISRFTMPLTVKTIGLFIQHASMVRYVIRLIPQDTE